MGVENLPLVNRQFICVEYPGRVKNVDRAIETLGGQHAIAEAVENPKNGIELKLRPKDPFAHHVSGEVKRIPGILLKVTRRRRKGQPEDEGEIKTEVLGTVTRTCRFRALADFQYLVPKEDRMRQLREALQEGNVQSIRDFRPLSNAEEGHDLNAPPPPLFSLREVPFNYGYKQNAPVLQVRVRQPDGSYAIKLVQRSEKTNAGRQVIRYTEPKVPSGPVAEKPMNADEERVAEKVGKLFQERPVWTRPALVNQLPLSDHKFLKRAMNAHCYTFRMGPWRDTNIRFGVDPRKDPSYHIYQAVGTRRRVGKKTESAPEATEQSSKLSAVYARTTSAGAIKDESERSEEDRKRHIFDGKRLPNDTATYCLCDITDPDLQNLIHSPAFRKPKCTQQSGFYYRCVIERIRTIVRKKLEEMETGKAEPVPNPEEGLEELIAKEKESKQDEDERAAEEFDQTQYDRWEGSNDPETAKMFETLRQAGALSALNTEDLNLEDLGLDELAGLGSYADAIDQEEADDDEGAEEEAEDKPLWQLDDLGDL